MHRIFLNFTALAFAKALSLVCNAFANIYVARKLGVDSLGILGFSTAFISYFYLLVDLGLSTYAAKEIARAPSEVIAQTRQYLGLRGVLTIVAVVLYLAAIALLRLPRLTSIVMLVQGLNLLIVGANVGFAYQGTQRMSVIAIRDAATGVLNLVFLMLFVHGPGDVVLAVIATTLTAAVNTSWLGLRFAKDFGWPLPMFDVSRWKAIVRGSAPIAASALCIAVFYNFDVLVLTAWRTTHDVGLYAAAEKIINLVIVLPNIAFAAFMPALAEATISKQLIRDRFTNYAKSILIPGALVIVFGVSFSGEIIAICYGPNFTAAAPALKILLISAGLVYLNIILGNPLWVWDKQILHLKIVSAGAVVNVACNLLLVPRFNIAGAAWASVVTEFVIFVLLAVVYFVFLGGIQLSLILRSVLGAAIAVLCGVGAVGWLELLQPIWRLVVGGMIANGVYMGLILVLRIVDLRQIQTMLRIVRPS